MSHSPASSDDEAPEVASFQSEKKAAQDRANAHQQFQTQEKEKRKAKNRRRDQAPKERASRRSKKLRTLVRVMKVKKRSRESVGRSRDDLEARMERAMMKASQEFDEDEDSENEERAKTLENPFAD